MTSNGWIVSLGSRTPSVGTTAGMEMGVVTDVVGATIEVTIAGVVTVLPVEAVRPGVVLDDPVVEEAVVTIPNGSAGGVATKVVTAAVAGGPVVGAVVITTGALAGGVMAEVVAVVVTVVVIKSYHGSIHAVLELIGLLYLSIYIIIFRNI